jgi:6-phosphogluconolactonase
MNVSSSLKAARRITPVAFGLAAIAALPAVASAATPHQFHHSGFGAPNVGHVYVNDNTAGTNTIAAFARNTNGSLTAVPGSPFTTDGAGTGAGLTSQGAIQTTADGRFVIAVDAGSNQVSVLAAERNGALADVPGGTVSSDGIDPVSVTVHGDLVYVANQGSAAGGSNLSGFVLTPFGQLYPLPNSTVALPTGATAGDVLFNGDGTKLIATLVGPSEIESYTVGWNGHLTAAPGSPFAGQGLGSFGSAFRPTNPDQLFVSNPHNGTGLGTVSAFNDSWNGTLNSIGTSPFADDQTAPCWVAITPNGQELFAVNTGSGSVSRYAIAPSGSLTLLGSTPVSNEGGVGATDAAVSPEGGFLYVNESKAGAIGTFAITGGNLTELAGSPTTLPAGATPAGIAVS